MTSDFTQIDVKTQQVLEGVDLTAPGELVLASLDVELTAPTLTEISHEKLAHYIAIKQWLKKYKPKSDASALEQVQGYLEVLHHLCELKVWKPIKLVFNIPISINTQALSFSLPLYEYLFFKGLISSLLESSQEIINSFQDPGRDSSFILILNARALFSYNRLAACNLLDQIILSLPSTSEDYLEATAHLGICQIQAGAYQEGIINLQKALIIIANLINGKSVENKQIKLIKLKSDIIENIAYSEMSYSRFNEAIKWYTAALNQKKQNKIIHKLVGPLVHLGILHRRMGDYNRAIVYLTEAISEAQKIQDENALTWIAHHLAWVFLNQGKPLLAEEQCKISLEGYKKMESQSGIADAYEQLGFVNIAKGEFEAADENFEMALNIREAIGNRHGVASCTMGLALAAWHKRQFLNFIKFLIQGFKGYHKIGVLNRVRFLRMLKLAYVWTVGKLNWTM